MTVFTNGQVTLTRDRLLGVSVLVEFEGGEVGWVPIVNLSKEELQVVRDLLDVNPTCPRDLLDAIEKAP